MARRPRISLAGYHHIINRGVARKHLLSNDDDKKGKIGSGNLQSPINYFVI